MKQVPDQAQVAAFLRRDAETTERQASAIERDVPTAKVVRIPNANHYVFLTQPDYVLQLIERFLPTLH